MPATDKVCTLCGSVFQGRRNSKYCPDCRPISTQVYNREYYREHKDECNAHAIQYYQEHKEERSAYNRAYYAANKERIAAQRKAARAAKKAAESAALNNNVVKEDPHND